VYLKSRGKNGGTWMHPILFIDFAMWINPKFKVKVLKFLHDKLIKHRIDTGDKNFNPQTVVSKNCKQIDSICCYTTGIKSIKLYKITILHNTLFVGKMSGRIE